MVETQSTVHRSAKDPKTESKESTGGTDMRDIGVEVNAPVGDWNGDENCPFYGKLRLRGQIIEGTVSRVGMQNTIVVERKHLRYMVKFERYEKRTRRYSAHLPSCIGEITVGDNVRIMECRPLSKTVTFCVIERGDSE
jgi:small subunit ribosomal protein S17